MRALTVRQPWAWAIIHGGKDVENRTRNLAGAHRGPIAIHAGKTWAAGAVEWMLTALGIRVPACLASGAIIGVVELVDVHRAHTAECSDDPWGRCSEWAEWSDLDNPVICHLVLANPRPLAKPIPWRGRQGLWNLPDDVLDGAL